MARPLKSGMDYFPHDTDASGDEKIEPLMLAHGPAGYSFYFILLERIYRTDAGELNISEAETRQLLARKMFITQQEFENMLATALKNGCFDQVAYQERSVLTSQGIKKRYTTVTRKRLINRNNNIPATETKQKQDKNPAETPESKVKERKVKERKQKQFIPPTVEEVRSYCKERGNTVDPQKFIDHYTNTGWRVGKPPGYPMKDWKAAIRNTWEKNNYGGRGYGAYRQDNQISGQPTVQPGKYASIGVVCNVDDPT